MMKKTLISILFLFGLMAGLCAAQGFCFESGIELSIEMDKDVFAPDEPVSGYVIINSVIPPRHTAVFDVTVYHEDEKIYEFATQAEVFFGETKYHLKKFGIPQLNAGEKSYGQWTIVISRQGLNPVRVEAEFRIGEKEDANDGLAN